jgi:AcrR family transcriptional regulator
MDTRRTILERALELFAARGYETVGVQEIVKTAGVTKPTLYHWFGSKQGLLEALLDGKGNPLIDRVRSAAIYEGDLPLTLARVANSYFEFAVRNPAFFRLQLALYFAPPESDGARISRDFAKNLHDVLIELFDAAARDHGNMRGRSAPYAVSFLGTLNTYVGLFLHDENVELDHELAFRAVHQFMHGIFS